MKQAEVVAEIARIEHELQRLQRELEALKKRVEPGGAKRTQAFAAPILDPPPAITAPIESEPAPKTPKSGRGHGHGPQPSAAPKTSTRTIPPTRNELGDTIPPPHANARRSDSDRQQDAGRYGFVSDSSRPRSNRRQG